MSRLADPAAASIQPNVGDVVQVRSCFAYRPPCRVIEVGFDECVPWLGRFFVAKYPTSEQCRQWDADENFRFDAILPAREIVPGG